MNHRVEGAKRLFLVPCAVVDRWLLQRARQLLSGAIGYEYWPKGLGVVYPLDLVLRTGVDHLLHITEDRVVVVMEQIILLQHLGQFRLHA